MGGRGSSSSKSKGGGGGIVGDGTQPTGRVSGGGNINIEFETEPKQEPTKAKRLENMNEAQVDLEIAQEQKIIESAQKIMDKNSTESAYMRGMREQFPTGVGGSGWSNAAIKRHQRAVDADMNRINRYTEAANRKQAAEQRLLSLEKIKNQIKGTGKTQKQIREEKVKNAVNKTMQNSTIKWERYTDSTAYGKVVVRKAGGYKIRTTDGTSFIYKGDEQLGSTSTVKKAMAYVENRIAKGK